MADVLVVDDEEGLRSFLCDALADDGHRVVGAGDGAEALRALRNGRFDVVLTDLKMPVMDGDALLAWLRAHRPECAVIVLTAHGTVGSAVAAIKRGAFDYLEKPIESPRALRALVARAAASAERAPEEDVPLSFGAAAMRPVIETLRRVARTDATVLLTGESGTGKELCARAIHRWSGRARGPFVAVNLSAMAPTVMESELFGHERGAFSGAAQRRVGHLESASGGTFLLDEVGELTASVQVKLLRVLEERSFERVGGQERVTADVRWVAATLRDLGEMSRSGLFRADLFHRLNVVEVKLPPLRERREDIGPMARWMLERIAAGLGREVPTLDEDARVAIEQARWPGNVRELRNTLERAMILSDGDRLRAADLGLVARPPEPVADARTEAPASRKIREMERDAIVRALSEHQGNRRNAAASLGIGLRTLYEKLRRYGIG